MSPPRHIAVIMDGNGRWAKQRGLPRAKGHEAGAEAVGECLKGCEELAIPYLTLYAFSYENWKRPPAEVRALMDMLHKFLNDKGQEMQEKNMKLLAIGRLERLPQHVRASLDHHIHATSANTGLTVTLALSYGGRLEILDAVQSLLKSMQSGQISPDQITEELFQQHLYTRDLPDPDLLIRTSGEMRLSNFLLWQISYTEVHVTPKLWPDFKKADLLAAVTDYQNRHRRFGGL